MIVSERSYLERSHRYGGSGEGIDVLAQHLGQEGTPGVDPDQDDVVGATVGLEYLVGDAAEGTLDVVARHHLWHLVLPGLTGPLLKVRDDHNPAHAPGRVIPVGLFWPGWPGCR